MKKYYFTMTGMNHYFGTKSMDEGMKFKIKKEPDNKYDHEAIKCTLKPLGKIGYLANSTYTVLGETLSAGRLYDKIGKKSKAKVVCVTERGVICEVRA